MLVKEGAVPRQGNGTEVLRGIDGDKIIPIKGVLFDFDGTLTLPGAIDFKSIKRELGCPLDHPILEFIAQQPEEKRISFKKILEFHEEAAARQSVPNRGVAACLLHLRKMEIPFGILTRNSLRSVQTGLLSFRCFSITDFSVVITRDNSLPKPSPDGVLKAASAMGFPPAELLVVGDFRFDVIAGKSAGAKTVLLTNGMETTMAPGDPEPDFVCRHLLEVSRILKMLQENAGEGRDDKEECRERG